MDMDEPPESIKVTLNNNIYVILNDILIFQLISVRSFYCFRITLIAANSQSLISIHFAQFDAVLKSI